VRYLARTNPIKTGYKAGSVNLNTLQEVARLSYFENGPLLAKEYLEKQGIYLVVVPHLPKTYLDGAAIMLPDGNSVIGLTLRHDRIEKEADEMTANGLIPKKVWDKKPVSEKATTEEVCALAEKLKIHPAIIAGRIRFERNNYRLLSNLVGNQQVRKHFADSFDDKG
jgi:HTH-type transcriptional regulator/antitoxin HigA